MSTTATTTHTPGPWLAYNADKGRTMKHWRIRGHCVRNDPTFATIDSNGKLSPEYEAANARLMAASPDLLATLKRVRTWTDYATVCGISQNDRELAKVHLAAIDAAIAKAEA